MPDILIVDDEDLIRESLSNLFTREGYSVEVAINGDDALKKIAANPPRVVVTDIVMPEKEGVATIMALRKTHPDIRIIAISGGGRRGSGQFLDAAERLGADATLAKPFSRQAIIGLVDGYLKG